MKTLILDPNFYKSATLMVDRRRVFNTVITLYKMLEIFKVQNMNTFETVPAYKIWKGAIQEELEFEEAMNLYYNCCLKVSKEIFGYKTQYEYKRINPDKLKFPRFTDLTFNSHRAFCVGLDYKTFYPMFKAVQDFNGKILIWEYPKIINRKRINFAEDMSGLFDKAKIQERFGKEFNSVDDFREYDLMEINREYIDMFSKI